MILYHYKAKSIISSKGYSKKGTAVSMALRMVRGGHGYNSYSQEALVQLPENLKAAKEISILEVNFDTKEVTEMPCEFKVTRRNILNSWVDQCYPIFPYRCRLPINGVDWILSIQHDSYSKDRYFHFKYQSPKDVKRLTIELPQ